MRSLPLALTRAHEAGRRSVPFVNASEVEEFTQIGELTLNIDFSDATFGAQDIALIFNFG